MRLLFNEGEIKSINGNDDPKEEMLGDCVELCLGILRIALMYENCGVDLFGWGDVNEILTGLEHSLLVFNASAYPSGLKNRKMGSKSGKEPLSHRDYTTLGESKIPPRKSPIVLNDVVQKDDDVVMTDATNAAGTAEGTAYGTAGPSTEADLSGSFIASGDEENKRRKITPQSQLRGDFENAIESLKRLMLNEQICTSCLSTEHKSEECPKTDAPDWYNKLDEVRQGIADRNSVLGMEDKEEVEVS